MKTLLVANIVEKSQELTFEKLVVPMNEVCIMAKKVFVISQACYEGQGPWGRDVFYHTGVFPFKNDDGNDFLSYSVQIRRSLVKAMKPGKSQATVKIPTSTSQFNDIWDSFLFSYSRSAIAKGAMTFSPDPNNITDCERMLLAAFSNPRTTVAADQALEAYRGTLNPIPMLEGKLPTLKRKLDTWIKQDSTDPALKYAKVEKTDSLSFDMYSRGLGDEEMDLLIDIVGPLESKWMKFNKARFTVVFVPSKFQVTITFTFERK